MNPTEDLQSIGLTKSEAAVYLALLELGETRTGVICTHTSIPSSNIYFILSKLQEHGLVTSKTINGRKAFLASSPSAVKTLFLKQKESLDLMERRVSGAIVKLQAIPKKDTSIQYRHFKGLHGIKALWLEVAQLMKTGTTIDLYTGSTENFSHLTAFYIEEHHKKRLQKKVKERIILPLGAKREANKRKSVGLIDVKYLPKHAAGEFAVFDNYIIMQHTGGKHPTAFLMENKAFAQMYREVFEMLWQSAKK